MSLLSWARQKLSLKDPRGWLGFLGDTWAGKPVTPANALQISAWWRSVMLYAEVTGTLPLKFYERLDNDERRQVKDHAVADLISFDPNVDQTTQEFWGCQAAGLCVIGNSYAEKRFIRQRMVALQPLPLDTQPYRDSNGDLRYRFSDRGKSDDLSADKVFHTRGFGFGGDVGLSPLTFARQSLSLSLATEEAAGRTFAQGMRASGFFVGPKLDKVQRDDFKKVFIDPIIGNDASAHYGILENGFDFKTINIPPKDAEMLLSRRFNVEEICRFMGVPPILVGHAGEGQTMWGTGVESILLAWLTLRLDAFLSNIEKSINKRLLKPGERKKFFAEFDRNALLRADSGARADFISKMIQNAQMTPNEGRRKDNRLPLPGGDVLLVNSTLVPLTMAGQKASKIQPAPGEPIPE
jgi:HK97 family phage portal protein